VECSYEYAAETIEHVDSIREESLESAVEAVQLIDLDVE